MQFFIRCAMLDQYICSLFVEWFSLPDTPLIVDIPVYGMADMMLWFHVFLVRRVDV